MSQNKVKQIIIVLNTGNMCNYAKQQINHAFNYLLEIMTSDLWYVPYLSNEEYSVWIQRHVWWKFQFTVYIEKFLVFWGVFLFLSN